MKPQNLLFIMSDQHSKEKYGAYGNEYVKTPNLDALAARGVRFDNAYCNNPICVPARACMTVGDYGFKYGFWDNCHPYEGVPEGWGHRLTEQGYRVTTIGKLHFRDDRPESGYPDQRVPLHLKDGIGDITTCIRDEDIKRPNPMNVLLKAGAGDSDYLRYDARVAELAAKFLKEEALANKGFSADSKEASDKEARPFCLYVGFVAPHFPLIVPEHILKMYEPYDQLPFPRQWNTPDMPMHPAIDRYRQLSCTNEPCVTREVVQKAVAAYYARITFMDEQVGIVLDALKAAGLEDSTRIIYTTDHGDSMGDHGMFFKNTMYEGSVSIPLVVAGPDIPKGTSVKPCVSLLDIFPTVLDCVGAQKKPEDMKLPGHSLWEYARGECTEERPIFAENHTYGYRHGVFMLRYQQYKLVYYVGLSPQLFDLENDPLENHDLAGEEDYAEVIRELTEKLYEICDPEEVDARALHDQNALLDRFGGKTEILRRMGDYEISYSPAPKD